MKALLLNGSPNKEGCTFTALSEVAKTLRENGAETELIWIGNKPIAGCSSCRHCMKKGECREHDQVNEITARLDEFDALIVGSPVYYASASGQITSFLDRLFFSGGSKMAGKVAAAVVSCRRGGASAAFDQLNKYFLMNNMIVVGSQYWNQVHGQNPDEVRRDLEGMQTMRTLARNAAWIMKSIAAGREAGIAAPTTTEKRVWTNFIREERE